jgi:hypothetical protein
MTIHASYCRVHLGWHSCGCPARNVFVEPPVQPSRVSVLSQPEPYRPLAEESVMAAALSEMARIVRH